MRKNLLSNLIKQRAVAAIALALASSATGRAIGTKVLPERFL